MIAKFSPALAQLRAHSLCPSPFIFIVIKQTGSITRPLIVTSLVALVSPKAIEKESKNASIPKTSDLLGLIIVCSSIFEDFLIPIFALSYNYKKLPPRAYVWGSLCLFNLLIIHSLYTQLQFPH